MNTQTISPKFTLNASKVHDQLDDLRAKLNEQARERGLDTAFEAGVLADALSDTDLGRRYLSLVRRSELLAYLPDRRTAIAWALVGGSVVWIARRRGWDKHALYTVTRTGNALRRAGGRLRTRMSRRSTDSIPAQFTVTPAAVTAYGLAGSDTPVTVAVPASDGYETRTGRLITLNGEYFAIVTGEMPYVFLPDQVAAVTMNVDANNKDNQAVITLIENPVPAPDLD